MEYNCDNFKSKVRKSYISPFLKTNHRWAASVDHSEPLEWEDRGSLMVQRGPLLKHRLPWPQTLH